MTKEKDNKIEKAKVDFEKDMIEVEQAEKERKTYIAPKGKKNNKVRTRRIVTGGVFCFLALVGLVSIITNIFSLGVKIVDNEGEKQEYNNLLTTLVVYDPLPFESPDQADQQMLLASSVWAAIMNEDMSIYETDEYGYTLLPAVDVDKYFSKVFGTGIKLEHGSFSDRDVEFEFNKDAFRFWVPLVIKKIIESKNQKYVFLASNAGLDIFDAKTGNTLISKDFAYGSTNIVELEENLIVVSMFGGSSKMYKIED